MFLKGWDARLARETERDRISIPAWLHHKLTSEKSEVGENEPIVRIHVAVFGFNL